MQRAKVFVLAAVLFVALAVATTGESLSGGIGRTTSQSLPPEGCNCHSGGKISSEVEILWRVDGGALVYEPGKVYNLTFGAAKTPVPVTAGVNQGGFNLRVNIGKLAPAPGWENFVQKLGDDTEYTHTVQGDKEKGRMWNLSWEAPAAPAGPAVFKLWINTVDGSGAPDEGDKYNGGVFIMLDAPGTDVGGAAKGVDPEHVGVNWLAHWVGIVSILAVVGTLLIYYFVLKFGESIHTTDHRDRKEK